jgi:hypothetical protein
VLLNRISVANSVENAVARVYCGDRCYQLRGGLVLSVANNPVARVLRAEKQKPTFFARCWSSIRT